MLKTTVLDRLTGSEPTDGTPGDRRRTRYCPLSLPSASPPTPTVLPPCAGGTPDARRRHEAQTHSTRHLALTNRGTSWLCRTTRTCSVLSGIWASTTSEMATR